MFDCNAKSLQCKRQDNDTVYWLFLAQSAYGALRALSENASAVSDEDGFERLGQRQAV